MHIMEITSRTAKIILTALLKDGKIVGLSKDSFRAITHEDISKIDCDNVCTLETESDHEGWHERLSIFAKCERGDGDTGNLLDLDSVFSVIIR